MIDGLSPSERLEAPSTERLGKKHLPGSLLEVFRASVLVIVSLVSRRCPRRATEQDMRYVWIRERSSPWPSHSGSVSPEDSEPDGVTQVKDVQYWRVLTKVGPLGR